MSNNPAYDELVKTTLSTSKEVADAAYESALSSIAESVATDITSKAHHAESFGLIMRAVKEALGKAYQMGV